MIDREYRLTFLSTLAIVTGFFIAAVFASGVVATFCIDVVAGALMPRNPFALINRVLLIYGTPIIGSSIGLLVGGWLLPRKTAVGRWIAIASTLSLVAAAAVYLTRGRALLQPVLAPVGIPGSFSWQASKLMADYGAPIMGVLVEGFLCWLAFQLVMLPCRSHHQRAASDAPREKRL